MLKRKLDSKTLKLVRDRADFFFNEQLKRLGPLPGLHIDAVPALLPVTTLQTNKRGRPRKTNPGG